MNTHRGSVIGTSMVRMDRHNKARGPNGTWRQRVRKGTKYIGCEALWRAWVLEVGQVWVGNPW